MVDCSSRRRTREALPKKPATSLDALDGGDVAVVDLRPAPAERLDHAHGEDRLVVAAVRVDHDGARAAILREDARRAAAGALGEERQRHQDHAAGERGGAEPGMDQEADERGTPASTAGRQTRSGRCRSGSCGSGRRREPDATPCRRAAVRTAASHDGAVHDLLELQIEEARGAHDHAVADGVEGALKDVGADEEYRERRPSVEMLRLDSTRS